MIGSAKAWDLLLRYGPALALAFVAGGGLWAAYSWAYDRGFDAKAAARCRPRRKSWSAASWPCRTNCRRLSGRWSWSVPPVSGL